MLTIVETLAIILGALHVTTFIFLFGLPFARKIDEIQDITFAITIGLAFGILIVFAEYKFVSPDYRKFILHLTAWVIAVIFLIRIKRRNHNTFHFKSFNITKLLGLFFILELIDFCIHNFKLLFFRGLSAGNGDLVYYSNLGKLLSSLHESDPGWVSNYSMPQDLFGHWGYGGGGGAAGLALSSLITDKPIIDIAFINLLAYCLILFLITVSLIPVIKKNSYSIVFSFLSVFNLITLYLFVQGFTQMFIAMIYIFGGLVAIIRYRNNSANGFSGNFVLYFIIANFMLYLCYPILAAPYMIGLLFTLFFEFKQSKRAGIKIWKNSYLYALVSPLIPILIWPSRVPIITPNLGVFTSGIPGWPLKIAKPSTLLLGNSFSTNFNWIDICVYILLVCILIIYFKKSNTDDKILYLPILCCASLLSLIFIIRDGSSAYTSWKSTFFIAPLFIFLVGIAAVKKSKWTSNLPVLLLTFMVAISTLLGISTHKLPLFRFPTVEMGDLLNGIEGSDTPVVLGPLDQLWAEGLTNRKVAPLAPNIHNAQKSYDLKTKQSLLSYSDLKTTRLFCSNFDSFNLQKVQTKKYFAVYRSAVDQHIQCKL